MARIDSLSNFLTDVADSIRSKTGKTDTIPCSSFDTEIESITTGGTTPTIGFVPTEWDSDGYITKGEFYGSSVPSYYFGSDKENSLMSKIDTVYFKTNSVTFNDYSMTNYFSKYINLIVNDESKYIFGEYAFYQNKTLESITIPANSEFKNRWNTNTYVQAYCSYAFGSCTALKKVVLPSDFTLYAYMFNGCTSLTDINLSDEIEIIYPSTFQGCTNLALTSLPQNLKEIRYQAFRNCTSLALTELPSNLTTIDSYALAGCTSLALTSLPSSLTTLGEYAFQGCTSLALTSLPSWTSIPAYFFQKCTSLALAELPSTMTKINSGAFDGCTSLALTDLPSGLTTLESYAFRDCTSLALTELPSGLTVLNTQVFKGCTSLVSITLSNNIKTINNGAFWNCTGLKKISMNNVTSIFGTNNFYGSFKSCTGLKQVWIGSAITSSGLGRYCFDSCTSLEKMYIDLPRATVEAFTNYKYAFMNDTTKTGIIICNDDEGFITKEEFDLLEVE